MLDTEQSSDTGSTEQNFDTVLGEIEAMPVADAEPAETQATPATATDPATPADAPAPSDTAPAADAPTADAPAAETPAAEVPTTKPFTFTVDKREVALTGAVEDEKGNIIIPKDTWHKEAKNYLADRSQWYQERSQWQQERTRLLESRTERDQVAGALLDELKRIVELPEAESFAEWEKLRADYPQKLLEKENQLLKGERQGRQTEAQQAQTSQVIETEVVPRLQEDLKGRMAATLGEAHKDVLDLVGKLPEADRAKVREQLDRRIFEALWEDALSGRIYYQNGETVRFGGVELPDVVPDLQRIARVVGREVEGMREALDLRLRFAEVETAARQNLQKEQARRPATPAPPAITAKGTTSEPVKQKEPTSWEEVVEAAQNVS